MSRKPFQSLAAVPCLIAVFFSFSSGAFADDLDDARAVIDAVIDKTLNDKAFLKNCFGMSAEPRNCDPGDTPGATLVCPPAPKINPVDQKCQVLDSNRFRATLGMKGKELLKLAGEFDVFFTVFGQDFSIPNHNHTPDGTARNCGTSRPGEKKFVKRQEMVKVVFAVVQKGEISVTFPTAFSANFGAFQNAIQVLVGKEKAIYREVGPNAYCIDETHTDNLACGEVSETAPRTPSPSPTGTSTPSELKTESPSPGS